jgi:dipeptidyl aminopeptidase/acylaminoacyl peptidase
VAQSCWARKQLTFLPERVLGDSARPKHDQFLYAIDEGGAENYLVFPNVRGSSGYGRTYLKLDNGMKREDSVKDIGALLD